MLRMFHHHRSTFFLLLALAVVDNKCMDEDGESAQIDDPSSITTISSSNTQPVIELLGTEKYVALGGNDLIILYRLTSSSSSSTRNTFHHHPYGSTFTTSKNPTSTKARQQQPTVQLVMYLTLQAEDEVVLDGKQSDIDGVHGSETLITKQVLSQPPTSTWQEVYFDCGWIVRGANYNIKLMEEIITQNNNSSAFEESTTQFNETTHSRLVSRITIKTYFPTIDFEVPHRLESYTASVPISVGLTKSLCKPKLPLPSTQLTLNICKSSEADDDPIENGDCGRIFAVLSTDPLEQLEKEGKITMTIGCNLWARNGYFRVQIQEGRKNSTKMQNNQDWIARSDPIKVDWSSRFELNFTQNRTSISPCPGMVGLEISYPNCIVNGLDKIRIYGYETLPVPSVLAPRRLNYISEKLIRPNRHHVSFSCTLFPQRFSRYCFQYINTAVDGSVAVVVENCLPTYPPEQFSDGGWGIWSSWSPCSTSCGKDGRKFRYRFCDTPSPSFGANYCQGNAIEEEACDSVSPDCASFTKRKSLDTLSIYEDEDDDEEQEYDEKADRSKSRRNNEAGKSATSTPPFFHINNLNYTFGCECGCLLHDLVPGFNYSLIVTLSPTQSYCEDEDEEEHHNLKWILHAKGDGNRIRFLMVGADLQCMTLSFRDGNTTDSNLLEVITMSTQSSLIQPPTTKQEASSGPSNSIAQDHSEKKHHDEGESRRLTRLLHIIESTGASLSIATSESSQNCSTPTVYFVAYYHIVPGTLPSASHSLAESPKHAKLEWNMYEFWSFLLMKFVLTFFVIIILFTTFGGFATKVYRRAKYRKLQWTVGADAENYLHGSNSDGENESEDDEDADKNEDEENRLMNSRSTSVTLMSFDHSYWRQIRTLRLKQFLLQPGTKKLLTKVQSFPSTPVHGKQIKLAFRTKSNKSETKQDGMIIVPGSYDGHNRNINSNDGVAVGGSSSILKSPENNSCKSYDWRHRKELNKLTSLSETNLKNIQRVNLLQEIANNEEDGKDTLTCYAAKNNGSKSRPSSIVIVRSKSSNVPITLQELSSFPLSSKNCTVKSGRRKCLCNNSSCGTNKCNCAGNIHGMNSPTLTATRKEPGEGKGKTLRVRLRGFENEKIRKEKENLKRKEMEMTQIMMKEECGYKRVEQDDEDEKNRDYKFKTRSSASSSSGYSKNSLIVGHHGRSPIPPTHLYNKYAESRDDVEFIDDDDEDGEQDFEMDYYDYDATNAANIPGSLFGLEPAFVLWNSEMFSQDEDDGETEDNITVSRTEELPRTISSTTNTYYDNDILLHDDDMVTMSDNGEDTMELMTTESNISNSSTAPPTTRTLKQQGSMVEVELQEQNIKRCGSTSTKPRQLRVRETSLDTLKFVDEAEFDDDEL